MSKYIERLTPEDIEEFLKTNNYQPSHNLKDNDGNILPAIEQSPNNIFVRCQKLNDDNSFDRELASYLMSKHPHFLGPTLFTGGEYLSSVEPLIFYDFYVSKLCITDEDQQESYNLSKNFVDFMANKFKSEYTTDYLIWLNTPEDEDVKEF